MSDADETDEGDRDRGSSDVEAFGGNRITDATPSTTVSISAFSPSEQQFLRLLQEEHPWAVPIKDHGNWVLVWMGEYRLDEFEPAFDQETAEVYMLIPKSFPNCDPHWIITAPALTVNGNAPDSEIEANTFSADHGSHGEKAQLAINVSNKHDTARAWSWRWSNANLKPENVEDIARAPIMVDSQLNQTERRQ